MREEKGQSLRKIKIAIQFLIILLLSNFVLRNSKKENRRNVHPAQCQGHHTRLKSKVIGKIERLYFRGHQRIPVGARAIATTSLV